MDRIWQWAWDRYGARYSWAIYAVAIPMYLPIYLVPALVVVASEKSDLYAEAATAAIIAVLVQAYVMVRPGLGLDPRRGAVGSLPGGRSERAALEATYTYARGAVARAVGGNAVWAAAAGSLSVRPPGRLGRGSSSTRSWVPPSELRPC